MRDLGDMNAATGVAKWFALSILGIAAVLAGIAFLPEIFK